MLLKDTYHSLRDSFTDLIYINEDEIALLDEKLGKSYLKKETNRMVLVNYLAASSVLFLPFILVKTISFFSVVKTYLLSKSGHYNDDYTALMTISLGITSIALLMYFFIMSNDKIRIVRVIGKASIDHVNTKQKSYVAGRIISVYLVLGALLYSVQLFNLNASGLIISALQYYIGVPASFAAFFVFVILTASLVLPLTRSLNKNQTINETRIELFSALITALYNIHKFYRPFAMSVPDTNRITRALMKSASLLRSYPSLLNKSMPNIKINNSFEQSANFIDQITIDFQTSNDIESINLKERLVTCLNIVVKGNLADLPKLDVGLGGRGNVKKAKVYHYLLLAVYLTLPIIFIISINLLFEIKFNEYEQSLLKILYIVWAFVGVFSNPVILNSDNKELIRDIVKSWLGKS